MSEEEKQEVQEIVKRNSRNIIWMHDDIKRLMVLYYTHVGVPYKYDTVQQAVSRGMECSGCKSQVIAYFKRKHNDTEGI